MQITYTNFAPKIGVIYYVNVKYNNKCFSTAFALYQVDVTLRRIPPKVKKIEIELIKELSKHGNIG